MNSYLQAGETLSLAAPYDRTSGQGAQIGSLFGVAVGDVLSGAEGQFLTEGVFSLAKTSAQAWTEGQKLYWDNSNKRLDSDGTVGMLVGVAAAVADNPSSVGSVRLNGSAPSSSEGPQAAIVTLTDSTGGSGTHDDTLADGLNSSAPAAISAYTAHAAGAVAVTSNAATDLDTTAAGLATAVSELTALRATVATMQSDAVILNQNTSDLAQKVIEILARLVLAGVISA